VGGIPNFDIGIRYLLTPGIYGITGCAVFLVTTVITESQYTGIPKYRYCRQP